MKKLLSLILLFSFVFCCDAIEGPTGPEGEKGSKGNTGPQGEQGEPGKDFKFTIIKGELLPGEPEFWIFETDQDLQWCIISVRVAMWIEFTDTWIVPTWIFWDNYISIYNDEKADSGNRYHIIITSDKDN